MIQTLGSEAVRVNWGKWLDSAYAKVDIVITRFGRPAVVMVNYEKWNALQEEVKQARLREALVQARAAYAQRDQPGAFLNEEEYQAALQAAGVSD